jgi:lipopolysaccharide export system protein LptA
VSWCGRRLFHLLALSVGLAAAPLAPGWGQGLTGLSGGGGGPLEIRADAGIEWRRAEQVYVARGNAVAARGDLSVRAETLTAHYREAPDGDGTEIYRIEAEGGVKLSSRADTAFGERGVYDLDKAVMVLTGEDLRLETGEQTITASDSLEYWDTRNLAVARGDAVARAPVEGGQRRIAAGILAAYLGEGTGGASEGGGEVNRIEAFENVRIASPQAFARGDKAVYVARSRIATLVGNVKVSRGENQLNGGYAEVNLRTGVSRLLGAPPDSSARARVRGLLRPGDDGLDAPATR